MKILSLLVVLIFINCCIAATNRSSVWLLANSQIFTTGSPSTQSCQITAVSSTTNSLTQTSPISLLTTSNLAITGTFVQLSQGWGTANWVSTATPYSLLYTLTIQFIYNSSYYIQLGIPANPSNALSINVATLFGTGSTYFTPYVSSSVSTLYPIVMGTNSISTPTGSTWITAQNIPSVVSSGTSGILITDYISSSTIAITQFTDAGSATPAAGTYNSFYQIGVRTQTSKISSTSSVLTSATGCTSSNGRKRSVEHLRQKRAIACSSVTSNDPTMTSSILQTACSAATSLYTSTTLTANTPAKTNTDLGTAFSYGVYAMNALYQVDNAIFSAGVSKYTTAANFGVFIAISSIFFSL